VWGGEGGTKKHAKTRNLSKNKPCISETEHEILTKEPCISAIEPDASTKEPYIPAKQPYIPTKEPYIPTKEPYIPTKEPYQRTLRSRKRAAQQPDLRSAKGGGDNIIHARLNAQLLKFRQVCTAMF